MKSEKQIRKLLNQLNEQWAKASYDRKRLNIKISTLEWVLELKVGIDIKE